MLRKAKKRRDSGTRSRVSKGPIRDQEHLAKVRARRCMKCNKPGPSEAHHIRECYPRTMGVRVGDDRVIPLCRRCHANLHAAGRNFWPVHSIPRAHAEQLYAETLSLRGEANP